MFVNNDVQHAAPSLPSSWPCSSPLFVAPPSPMPTAASLHGFRPSSSRCFIRQLPVEPWMVREPALRRGNRARIGTRRHDKCMSMMSKGSGDDKYSKGAAMLQSPNLSLVRVLVTGELAVGVAAAVLAFFGQVNPFAGIDFSTSAIGLAFLGALPIFGVSVLLEKSGVDFFRKIDQDTKLYVVQVFGAERNWPAVAFWALVLAANAGFFEEVLFRGVIQQWLGPNIGDLPALGLTAVLFGLAHDPVPGASSFTEACYGANFGLLYLMSGGNIFVPIIAHVVYDLLTFLEVHQRATAQLEISLNGDVQQKEQEQRNVGRVVREFKLSQKFVDMSYGVFKQLDLDQNGVIDQKELQLGLRTFGKFASDEETRQIMGKADLDHNNALSFDEWVRLLALNYASLLQMNENNNIGA